MIDPHELPDESWENSVKIPLSEDAEYVATLRVMDGSLTKAQLRAHLGMLARAVGPIKVEYVFGSRLPPPIFCTVTEAAEALSITEDHLLDLIRLGWLKPIRYADEKRKGSRPPTKEAVKHQTWRGFERRVIWAELVALAEWISEEGTVPTWEPPPKMRRWQTFHRTNHQGNTVTVHRISMGNLAKQLLRDAVDEDGAQRWLTVTELQDMVLKYEADAGYPCFVKRATIASGINHAKKKGHAEMRELKRDEMSEKDQARVGARGRVVVYRWIPEADRKEASWDRPPANFMED